MISRILVVLFILILPLTSLLSAPVRAQGQNDISMHRKCTECGMDRKDYAFSRMLVTFADGREVGVCSIHCAITVMYNNKGEKVKALFVADRNTHDLIPTEKAIWVLGGKKQGVMTMRAKWAFSTKEAAQDFVKEYEGKIVSWDEALAAALTDALPKAT